MAESYSVTQYLLDRANIQDVIELLYFYFDIADFKKMRTQIWADNVTIDFTVMWGGEPFTLTGGEMTDRWENSMQSKAASAQHIVSSVVPILPQPGSGTESPTSAKAFCNGSALVKSFKDNIVQNTGRLYVDLIKLQGSTENGNPWRISGLKAEMVWENGVPIKQLGTDYDEHFADKK